MIAQARIEVERMRELVDDVLFLSEVEAGREVVALQGTPVLTIHEDFVEAAQARAGRHGIELVVVASPDVVVPLRPRLFRTLVDNLLANVFRHGLGATRATLAARREGDRILFAVVDNGAGIRDADLGRIFERFYRGVESRSSAGSGLGLSIVKHVVAAAGGHVEARRGPGGVGVEIRCTFPG